MREHRPHLVLVEHLTALDLTLGMPDPLLRCRVRQEFQGRLDRLQILRGQQHHVITAVAGDVYPLVGYGPTSSAISDSRAFASESGTVVIDQILSL